MKQAWRDYALFHALQVYSQDMDPAYPVLKHLQRGLDPERQVWLSFLHVAYYHLGSALAAFERYPDPCLPEDLLKLPCATERRGHRDPRKLAEHFIALRQTAEDNGGLHAWISSQVSEDPLESWSSVVKALQTIHGNGRWASYKMSEILWKVNGFALEAPDMGHANSSGPRQGLALLFDSLPQGNSPGDIALLDQLSLEVVEFLKSEGARVSIETAETSLCDFHALVEGRYYVGHDIDGMLEQIIKVPSGVSEIAYAARSATIPPEYLGELNGWTGIDRQRKRIYRDTGKIVTRRQSV